MAIICVRGLFRKFNNTILTSTGRILIAERVDREYPFVRMYFKLYHLGGNVYKILQAMRMDTKELI